MENYNLNMPKPEEVRNIDECENEYFRKTLGECI